MKKNFAAAFPLLLALAASGCASGGGGAGGDQGSETFRADLGNVIQSPLVDAREKVWTRHSIPLRREEVLHRSLYFESDWMVRQVEPEERAAGIGEARNRVVLRGVRTGDELLDGVPVEGRFRATLEVENQVRTEAQPEWHPAPMPAEVLARFRRVVGDMEMEVRAGVRR